VNDEKLQNMGVWETKNCEIWEFEALKFGKYGSYTRSKVQELIQVSLDNRWEYGSRGGCY
jgi:hypothetical protein